MKEDMAACCDAEQRVYFEHIVAISKIMQNTFLLDSAICRGVILRSHRVAHLSSWIKRCYKESTFRKVNAY